MLCARRRTRRNFRTFCSALERSGEPLGVPLKRANRRRSQPDLANRNTPADTSTSSMQRPILRRFIDQLHSLLLHSCRRTSTNACSRLLRALSCEISSETPVAAVKVPCERCFGLSRAKRISSPFEAAAVAKPRKIPIVPTSPIFFH
jgi:hypothetical protein